jgi:hypothetical protein
MNESLGPVVRYCVIASHRFLCAHAMLKVIACLRARWRRTSRRVRFPHVTSAFTSRYKVAKVSNDIEHIPMKQY